MKCPKCSLEIQASASRCNCGYVFAAGAMKESRSSAAAANRAPRLSVKGLNAIESRLNRSFYAAVVALIVYIVINGYFGIHAVAFRNVVLLLIIMAAALLALGGYIWYVVSLSITAKAINKRCGPYLFWAIGGPILSLIPVPIPLWGYVSMALAVAPLTIKFLLSGEIRTMIRFQTLRDMH